MTSDKPQINYSVCVRKRYGLLWRRRWWWRRR